MPPWATEVGRSLAGGYVLVLAVLNLVALVVCKVAEVDASPLDLTFVGLVSAVGAVTVPDVVSRRQPAAPGPGGA